MDVYQFGGIASLMDKESECSSCIDGLELRAVADQQYLRAFFGCEAGDSVKGERARERGFVHDDELPGVERGAGGPVGLPPFRRVLRRDAQVLGRTWAAPADGARPTTEPAPCSRSQARRRAFIAVVFPAPAGPTSTSRMRPETAIRTSASAWSSPSTRPSGSGRLAMRSIVSRPTVGPVVS